MRFVCEILGTRYRQERSGWSVLSVRLKGEKKKVAAVGVFPPLENGEWAELEGEWTEHPQYGPQIKVSSFRPMDAQGGEGIVRFFASGNFRNVGQGRAKAIYARFGDKAIDLLRDDPSRIRDVPGFSARMAAAFVEDWNAAAGSRDALVLLMEAGVGPATAQKICAHFKDAALEALRENPYGICDEIFGVGFSTADRIARTLGTDVLHPRRMRAGFLDRLKHAATEGHLFLRREQLLARTRDLLVSNTRFDDEDGANLFLERLEEQLPAELEEAERGQLLVESEEAVYLPLLYRAERTVADWISGALRNPMPDFPREDLERALDLWAERESIRLDGCQRDAVLEAATSPVFVLTGGPGTGKTTTLRGLVELLSRFGRKFLLAAPTGRAAKRMAEVTGEEAKTVHRLLEFDPHANRFGRNETNQFRGKTLIVDESSMIDVPLMSSIVRALGPGCSVVLVGDADQLPSIGPGTLFRDLLQCSSIPSARLSVIHRQGADSMIPRNAVRINSGEMPEEIADDSATNFHVRWTRSAEETRALLLELVSEEIPKRYGAHPMRDVQVLLPRHHGVLGTDDLNAELQRRLNADNPPFRVGGLELRRGDKMMQQRNNYDLNVFNGDVGAVVGIDPAARKVQIDFGEVVSLGVEELDDVRLAYACTIHKSQGSEYPFVVVALDPEQGKMLQRTLLYTAVTRAKSHVFLIGSRLAALRAVQHEPTERRNGRLRELLAAGDDFFRLLDG